MKCDTDSTVENLYSFSENDFQKIKSKNNQKQTIFQIKNYQFLKKKRQESINKTNKKKPWKIEEDQMLTQLVTEYSHLSWSEMSSFFKERTPIQCRHRWTKVLAPGLKKGKWSKEEDIILLKWIEKEGPGKWSKLAILLKGRSSKQIRDRWVNNLNPERNNFKWTEELDQLLLKKYIQKGSSWVLISKEIENSTENMVKNRFYSLLRSCASRYSKAKKSEKIKKMKEQLDQTLKVNEKKKQYEKFLTFDYENENEKIDGELIAKPKYKRKNPSLTCLIDFLPYLLEERGIDINEIEKLQKGKVIEMGKENMNNKDIIINESVSNNNNNEIEIDNSKSMSNLTMNGFSFNFNEEQKKILSGFFTTLTEKFQPINNNNNNSNEIKKDTSSDIGNSSENVKKLKENQPKFKSTILLNLQLVLLNKIFERLKVQIIQKFFECFKENTLSS